MKLPFLCKTRNEIKKTLEENKIFLDTIAATTIAVAGLAVSIASFYLSYQANKFTAQEATHQRNLAKISTPPYLRVSTSNTDHLLAFHSFEIENSGGPALNAKIQSIAFSYINFPYENQLLKCQIQEISDPKIKFLHEENLFLRIFNESEFNSFYKATEKNKGEFWFYEFKSFYKISYENVENHKYSFFIEASKFGVRQITEDERDKNLVPSEIFDNLKETTLDLEKLPREVRSLLIEYDLKQRYLNCIAFKNENDDR